MGAGGGYYDYYVYLAIAIQVIQCVFFITGIAFFLYSIINKRKKLEIDREILLNFKKLVKSNQTNNDLNTTGNNDCQKHTYITA